MITRNAFAKLGKGMAPEDILKRTLAFIPTKMENSEQRNGTHFNLVTWSTVLSPFLARVVLSLKEKVS